MSAQNAVVQRAPARTILDKLFSDWGREAYGLAWFDCAESSLQFQQTTARWDGSKLSLAGTVSAPCTGKLVKVTFYLRETAVSFEGHGELEGMDVPVSQGQTITVYYIETLTSPTSASVQIT